LEKAFYFEIIELVLKIEMGNVQEGLVQADR